MDGILVAAVAAAFAASMIVKAGDYILYLRLYSQSANMSSNSSDVLRLIKKRFTDCISLGKPIENTEDYVKKMLLSSHAYSPVASLRKKLQSVMLGIFYILLWLGYILEYYSYDSFILYIVTSLMAIYLTDRLMDITGLFNGAVARISDYLDNTLRLKLSGPVRNSNPEVKREEPFKKENQPPQNTQPLPPSDDAAKPDASDSGQDALIASIIDEFML